MNPKAQEYLDRILRKSPDTLTPIEIAFLRARRGYLKASQLEEYKSVLEDKPNPKPGTVKKDGKQHKPR